MRPTTTSTVGTALATVALLLLATMGPAASATETHAPERVLVDLSGADATRLAAKHGLSVATEFPELGMALLEGPRAASKLQREMASGTAERDGAVRIAGATWDAATWDAATWDAATWDAATWDAATWDAATWDAATWDAATWDAATWDAATWDAATWDSMGNSGPVPPWGLYAIGAPEAWAHGVVMHNRLVCVVDSGVSADHPALVGNLWRDPAGRAGANLIEPDQPPVDDHGHGTHLIGIIAARPHLGLGVGGIAAPLVASAKVMGADGTGKTSDVLAGIDWCLSIGADILLLALTEDAPTKSFTKAVQRASSKDVIVVASAGNGGPCERCISSPGSISGVVAVGAFGPDGAQAGFSSEGPQARLLAPGVHIASTYPGGLARASSGTSQAAAFVAGSLALLWSHAPDSPADRIVAQLRATADRDGRIDLAEAVKLTAT